MPQNNKQPKEKDNQEDKKVAGSEGVMIKNPKGRKVLVNRDDLPYLLDLGCKEVK